MAVPVIASSSTVSPTTIDPVLTKPTGLAEGDLLLAFIFTGSTVGNTVSECATPSGWSLVQQATSSAAGTITHRQYVFSKIATAGDVAASTFTFDCDDTGAQNSAVLCRITGSYTTNPADFAVWARGGSGANPTVTLSGGNIRTADTLLFMAWFTANIGIGTNSFSNYAVTGITNPTWTELIDFDGGNSGETIGALAYATSGVAGTVTQIEVDEADGGESNFTGMLVGLSPLTNATGTNALLSVSPTTFSQTGSAGTIGTNNLLEVSPILNEQSGFGKRMPVLVNEDKPSTIWTNDTI